MSIQVDTTDWTKGKHYPTWMNEIGLSMISKGYLLPDEDVFDAFKRVSRAAAKRLKRKDLQPYFYEAMTKNWLCLASPVLSNMGTERGMPISCFGIDTDDSIEGIKDWVLLKIDTDKIPGEYLKLYIDPNFKYGYYTLNNIPPQAIEKIKEINI
jgi:hypothetical protein